MEGEDNRLKIVAVGDTGSGKTSLIIKCNNDEAPDCPKVYVMNYCDYIAESGRVFMLNFWDTAVDGLRPLAYPGTDVFLICVSIVGDPQSVCKSWYPEISFYFPNVPVIVVGTKFDLRDNKQDLRGDEVPVSIEEMKDITRKIGAFAYIECSALTNFNIQKVMEVITEAALSHIRPPSTPRSIFNTLINKFKTAFEREAKPGVVSDKHTDSTQRLFHLLPKHISLLVLSFMDYTEVYRFGMACRATHELAEEAIVWIQLCLKKDAGYKYIPPVILKSDIYDDSSSEKKQEEYLTPKRYFERWVKSVWRNPSYSAGQSRSTRHHKS